MKSGTDDKQSRSSSRAFIILVIAISLIAVVLITAYSGTINSKISSVLAVLSPVTYGFVIAYLCNPLVNFFEKHVLRFKKAKRDRSRIKRVLSIILSLIVLFAIISAFILILIPQISESYKTLSSKMGDYVTSAQSFANDTIDNARDFVSKHESLNGIIDFDRISEQYTAFLADFPKYLQTAASYLLSFLMNFLTGFKNILFGLILSIYMLYSKEKISAQFKKLLQSVTSRRTYLNIINLTRFTDRAFGGFIKGKLLDSLIIGLICFIIFGLAGFNYYPLIALVIAITNLVPIFGPIFGGAVLAVILLITQPSKVILFIIIDILIQQLDGSIIGPRVLGESIGISGMWVMISILVAGGLFGLPGMVLGIPAFAVIYSLLKQLSEKRLKKRNIAHNTESYLHDPPERDYLHSDIFIRPGEEIPENMTYPEEVTSDGREPKKKLLQKVEEKAIEKAKSRKKKK